MSDQTGTDLVRTSTSEGVRTIRLSKPPRNLLDGELVGAMLDALHTADSDDAVSGILLTGSGGSFCGGLDVTEIETAHDAIEAAKHLVGLLRVLPTLTTPIAAAVNGDAVAGGASIVCACDYAVAVPDCSIGAHEVSIGFWPMVAQVPLIHRLGPRVAMENVGSGEPFTAARALEVGVVNKVVEQDDLLDSAAAWLRLASRGWPGRDVLYRFAEMSYDQALDASLSELARMLADSPDLGERLGGHGRD